MRIIFLISLIFLCASCQEEETCADEDKIVQYTENTTYHYTVMEPELVCP